MRQVGKAYLRLSNKASTLVHAKTPCNQWFKSMFLESRSDSRLFVLSESGARFSVTKNRKIVKKYISIFKNKNCNIFLGLPEGFQAVEILQLFYGVRPVLQTMKFFPFLWVLFSSWNQTQSGWGSETLLVTCVYSSAYRGICGLCTCSRDAC